MRMKKNSSTSKDNKADEIVTVNIRLGWLYGWKDIACYVGCDITTVHKWFLHDKLPIHRAPKNKPVAIPSELDYWLKHLKKP